MWTWARSVRIAQEATRATDRNDPSPAFIYRTTEGVLIDRDAVRDADLPDHRAGASRGEGQRRCFCNRHTQRRE